MIVFPAFVQAAQDFWHFHLALNLSRYTRSNDNDCREITDLMFILISVSFLLFFWRYVPSSWQSSSSKIDKSLTLNDRYVSYLTNRKSFKVGLSPSKKFGFICVNESPLKISFFMASQTGTQTITMGILPDISKRKGNQTMKFGQSIEYNVRNIFLRKSYRK